MIHKGEKPFQCEICSKRFREKSNYNFHMKKHLTKSNKKNESKQKLEKKDLVMDNNINNFCNIYENKNHNLSNLSNCTESISNNSFEIINKLSEDIKNDNIINPKTKSIFQINKKPNNDNLKCPYLYGCSNDCIINCMEDDLKSLDEQSLKYDLNNDLNDNILLNLDYTPLDKKDNHLNEKSEISSSNAKEEKEEEEKNEQNFDIISIVNGNCDHLYINNAINNKINLTDFNNNFSESCFPLNFISMFLNHSFN